MRASPTHPKSGPEVQWPSLRTRWRSHQPRPQGLNCRRLEEKKAVPHEWFVILGERSESKNLGGWVVTVNRQLSTVD